MWNSLPLSVCFLGCCGCKGLVQGLCGCTELTVCGHLNPLLCSCGLDDEVIGLWGLVCCANVGHGRAITFWAHWIHINCDLPYHRRQVISWFSKNHQLQKGSPHTYSYHATELSARLSNHIYRFDFAWIHIILSCVTSDLANFVTSSEIQYSVQSPMCIIYFMHLMHTMTYFIVCWTRALMNTHYSSSLSYSCTFCKTG